MTHKDSPEGGNSLGETGEFCSVGSRTSRPVAPTEECRPVLFSIPGTRLRLLAVRVTVPGKTPLVFPLSRDDLGRVWETSRIPAKWKEEKNVTLSWTDAWEEHGACVGYPIAFLIVLLQAFRAGTFQDGTPISNCSWDTEALGDVRKMAAFVHCTQCQQVNEIPVSALHLTKEASQPLTCTLLGGECRRTKIANSEQEEEWDRRVANEPCGPHLEERRLSITVTPPDRPVPPTVDHRLIMTDAAPKPVSTTWGVLHTQYLLFYA